MQRRAYLLPICLLRHLWIGLLLLGIVVHGDTSAFAADKLVVSVWGGSWKEMIADIIGKRFTAETGVEVEFITGGTIDRLNKAKLSQDNPESDITFTTSHVGWLYVTSGLFEPLDLSKVPNAANLVDAARISPYHVGTWAYVYTIAYRPDLVKNITFESWADLWKPEVKGLLAAPDFDPSHIIAVAAILSGGDAAHWEKGQAKLKELKPSFKAFYTNDANSQQLIASGETPVQIMLSMNAHFMIKEGAPIKLVIPKEGAVLGVDTIAIMKGSKHIDLAHKFINLALDPEVQAQIATFKKGSPTVINARLPPEIAALPGVFSSPEQWRTQAITINDQLRAEKLSEWRKWFLENIIAR
jgi:putative spermidine/putrescine transport system substrate-binding protein